MYTGIRYGGGSAPEAGSEQAGSDFTFLKIENYKFN
jgi:hypothetical protein